MRKKRKYTALFSILGCSLIVLFGLMLAYEMGVQTANSGKMPPEEEEYYLPTVVTKRVAVPYGTQILPEMFIQSVESIYQVSFSYEKSPDVFQYGVQDVIVLVTDEIGNSAAVKAQINILNLKERLELNLGDALPEAEEFLEEKGSKITYVSDISGIDTSVSGEYSIVFMIDEDFASAVLSVGDYEPPVVVTKNVETWVNHPVTEDEFVISTEDTTKVEYVYEKEPDWNIPGEQKVTILAYDENKNLTRCETMLYLKVDDKSPVVSVSDVDVIVGGVVSYRKAVEYYDNASTLEEMVLTVDNSQVNLNEIGTYAVEYTVTDFAGNSTRVVGKVNIVEKTPVWNDEGMMQAKAEEVLNEILSEGMSDYEKAEAIFKWVNTKIRFINYSEKDNFLRGAYEGMFLMQGDCFVYAATSKYLLTLAKISNIDIRKADTNPAHYWNLVYIEDGWYHFDACPTREGKKLFLYTDAELEAFSSSRGNSHQYDKNLYPEIK